MKRRVLLTVAYDGTAFNGWQKQPDPNLRTVEGELEASLRALFRDNGLQTNGASRTDSGVHALGQAVTIDVDSTMPSHKIPIASRSFLPEDIVITAAEDVADGFHPRYHAVRKTYEYRVISSAIFNPKERLYAMQVRAPLDVLKMQEATKYIVGKQDFAAFCAAGGSAKTSVRTILSCEVKQEGNAISILVTGDGFLYNMVRILAGTLIYVGQGKIAPKEVAEILQSRDRTRAGLTADAQGLTLLEIYYHEADKQTPRAIF